MDRLGKNKKLGRIFLVTVLLAMTGITIINISPQCQIQLLSTRCEDTSGRAPGCEDWPEGSKFSNVGNWCVAGVLPGMIALGFLASCAGLILMASILKSRHGKSIRQMMGVISLLILFASIWIPTHDLGNTAVFGKTFLWGESSTRVFQSTSVAWFVDPLEAFQQAAFLFTVLLFLCVSVRKRLTNHRLLSISPPI